LLKYAYWRVGRVVETAEYPLHIQSSFDGRKRERPGGKGEGVDLNKPIPIAELFWLPGGILDEIERERSGVYGRVKARLERDLGALITRYHSNSIQPTSIEMARQQKRYGEAEKVLRELRRALAKTHDAKESLMKTKLAPSFLIANADLGVTRDIGKAIEKALRGDGIDWDRRSTNWKRREKRKPPRQPTGYVA